MNLRVSEGNLGFLGALWSSEGIQGDLKSSEGIIGVMSDLKGFLCSVKFLSSASFRMLK